MDNILIILYLVFIEGILSLDNALALAAIVHKADLRLTDQKHALQWGIVGAYGFRILVILIGVKIMMFSVPLCDCVRVFPVRLVAGLYLVWLAITELRPKYDA